jgi:translation initiation factor 2 subunit 3
MFFYTENCPLVNDYVIIRVKEIKEFGYICELPEYDNISALLNINDITTEKIKKIHDLKKYLNLNTVDVLEIKEIDSSGNINLNRKYLDDELKKEKLQKFYTYEKILNYTINNKHINETDKNEVADELKNYKVKDIDVNDFSTKFSFLSNLRIKTEKTDEINEYIFELKKYENVYSVKENFLQVKKEYNLQDICIINSKIGKFSIKTNSKFGLDYFKNIEFKINNMDYSQQSNVDVKIIDQNENIQPLLNIGIIGHVSHGKTTLIQRLTNVDTKKYKKELETNKTLKLGYTNAYVTKCSCSDEILFINNKCSNIKGTCSSKFISIVDCPGHHILMNTMLCGTSIMDTAIVMIAANETCPQPQTIDHVMAITINDNSKNFFDNGLIVLNKCDLVKKEQIQTKYTEVKDFIQDSLIKKCNIVPTSAQKNINLNLVTEWMYNYVCEKEKFSVINQESSFRSLIVRTFDINKPGTIVENISGLVIGCSILEGVLNIGDEIVILPEFIKTKVYELYTDKSPLNSARKGGLIGIKTDLNPEYSDMLIGSFFIKTKDFNQDFLKDENDKISLNYFLRKDTSIKKIFKENEYIDVNIQGKFIKNCKILTINKSNKIVNLQIPYKTYFTNDNMKISFLKNNSLIGYGEHKKPEHDKTTFKMDLDLDFNKLLDDLYDKLHYIEKLNMKNIIKLPPPIISFSNTFSTFYNFIETSNLIDSNHMALGNFIMNELGLKSMSINDNQLILKGRADENKIQIILTKYLVENKLCKSCFSYNTVVNKVQNCRLLVCKDCNYTIKK